MIRRSAPLFCLVVVVSSSSASAAACVYEGKAKRGHRLCTKHRKEPDVRFGGWMGAEGCR